MKGILFTEFLQLVENNYGLETVDKIIQESDLSTNGAYTSVGKYEFSEMLSLLNNLSKHTHLSVDELLLVYSEHFFKVLSESYLNIIARYASPLELIASIDEHVRVEVLKIYPDSELPKFEIIDKTDTGLTMIYSSRAQVMHTFGLGLMHKTFEYFNKSATIEMEKIEYDGTKIKFVITENE